MHSCPFAELAARHTNVVCALHRGLLDGALEELAAGVCVERLTPWAEPGICRAVLHERVALLTLVTDQVPHVGSERRLEIQNLGSGFHRLVGRFGFMEDPNVPELLKLAEAHGFKTSLAETTFFLGRETLVPTLHSRLSFWRKALFSFLSRNAQSATAFFRLPPNRVVELGEQIEF